ncbi:MAG: NlpC/P60 family protein [Methylococcales bacterium]|nr:NlpC/P60 family protein [Methylococcales bacterium]
MIQTRSPIASAIDETNDKTAKATLLQRQAIVNEAMSWLRTPWRHASAVKGAGVDCGRLLIEVYANCGLIERYTPDSYPQDFALHSSDERFLRNIKRYTVRVDNALMGDIAVWKYGRCFSHAAIVIEWPTIIHAKIDEGVLLDLGDQGELALREVRFYSVFTADFTKESKARRGLLKKHQAPVVDSNNEVA